MSSEGTLQHIIERKIFLFRGEKVMLDKDLAALYQVRPIALRQQVSRNKERFPDDFMFRLNDDEVTELVSQNVIPSKSILGGHNTWEAITRMSLPSRAWPCSPVFYAVPGRF